MGGANVRCMHACVRACYSVQSVLAFYNGTYASKDKLSVCAVMHVCVVVHVCIVRVCGHACVRPCKRASWYASGFLSGVLRCYASVCVLCG